MAMISGMQRRGAIYSWRRRIPPQHGAACRRTHVCVSLGTPAPTEARRLAAELNVVMERLRDHLPMMSTGQVKGVFQQVLLRQIAKPQQVVATSMSDRDFSTKESIRNDTLWHWAYRWLAARGPYANVDDVAEGIMREAGLSEADIYGVAERLVGLRYQDMVPIPPGKISTLLEAVGAVSTESNIALAQQAYFRAMSQAAALSARSQREGSAAEAEAV